MYRKGTSCLSASLRSLKRTMHKRCRPTSQGQTGRVRETPKLSLRRSTRIQTLLETAGKRQRLNSRAASLISSQRSLLTSDRQRQRWHACVLRSLSQDRSDGNNAA